MSLYWLLKREWLEHGSAFYWGMGILVALILSSVLIVSLFDLRYEVDLADLQQQSELQDRLVEQDAIRDDGGLDGVQALTALALDVAGSTDAELQAKVGFALSLVERVFHWMFVVISIFALVACLHDERKDQSVLFWKSMPVSDTSTVLTKFVFVAWVAPLVAIAGIFFGQMVLTAFTALSVEEGMAGRIWVASDLIARPFALLFGYLVQGFWALPVFAWFMCVSVFAARAPLLWALGIPWIFTWFEGIFFGTAHFGSAISEHFKAKALPHNYVDIDQTLSSETSSVIDLIATSSFWVGIVVGVALLVLTIYGRRRYNEL